MRSEMKLAESILKESKLNEDAMAKHIKSVKETKRPMREAFDLKYVKDMVDNFLEDEFLDIIDVASEDDVNNKEIVKAIDYFIKKLEKQKKRYR